MKTITRLYLSRCFAALALAAAFIAVPTKATPILWGLTLTNIDNATPTSVVTNSDGSVSITTGGGDTYTSPDSFAYAYQQVTGDFDIRVRIINCVTANANGQQDSAKASLMVRASLDPDSYDFMINALPTTTDRNGQIESIGRLNKTTDTDDLPGRNLNYGTYSGNSQTGDAWSPVYGGDTTDNGYCTYPDVWLRIRRQGNMLYSYFASTNTEEYPQNSNPGSTNGWQLLCCAPTSGNFGSNVYIGLSTVAHNNDLTDPSSVTSTYASYGPTPFHNGSASIPTTNGVPVPASMAPGPFPNTVMGVNWDVSIPANGLGYPGNTEQLVQGPPSQIVWDTGGYTSVSRDVIAGIDSESALGFAAARYQCSGFDYAISPNNTTNATNNLGPYTNPLRDRYSSGDATVPACQAWCPSPNYGFVFPTIHKNGAAWNDQSGPFWAASYIQLDPGSSSYSYDMIGGQFQVGQAYTRTTKLVVGNQLTNGAGSSGAIERAAISHDLVWFPYSQGWRAGYFDDVLFSGGLAANPGIPMWKPGDGWGLYSGTALDGCTNGNSAHNYSTPQEILNWVDAANGVYDGLAFVTLPGVNSINDGMLFTVGNDEANGQGGPSANNAAAPDGSGWWVAVRDIYTSASNPTVYATDANSDAGTSFSFIFIPWTANNLIGGHIKGSTGATIKGAGNFTLTRTSVGHYQLTIPGKTDANGCLMLLNSGYLPAQPSGMTNVVDNSFLSYEYGGTNSPNNVFMINAVTITNAPANSSVVFADADFNFVWVDFSNPLSLTASTGGTTNTGPVASITQSGSNVVVSWTGGAGFQLQSSGTVAGPWTSLGTQNPQTLPLSATNRFFRVVP